MHEVQGPSTITSKILGNAYLSWTTVLTIPSSEGVHIKQLRLHSFFLYILLAPYHRRRYGVMMSDSGTSVTLDWVKILGLRPIL